MKAFSDDALDFIDEATEEEEQDLGSPWRVLVVDDDPDVFQVTQLNLKRLRFRDRGVQLLAASSGEAARALLEREYDIALALVDVVMETETAGLDLIRSIRADLKFREMRIILRTGQPGQAPEKDIILNYEIDGYAAKADLTAIKLFTAVVAALRTYEALSDLSRLTQELESRVLARTADLEKLAMLDPLTGVANRRHFEMRAAAEIADARRAGHPLATLVIDIDHFKRINDHHGHGPGDTVLRQFAERVAHHIRPSGLFARIGGEEFALLLPRSDLETSLAVAERIRAAIAAEPFELAEGSIPVTASFGVALLATDDADFRAPLHRADQALYRAKAAGRNRVLS